jgi:hypothetical protein
MVDTVSGKDATNQEQGKRAHGREWSGAAHHVAQFSVSRPLRNSCSVDCRRVRLNDDEELS